MSKLDANQVIKEVYDDSTGRLKVQIPSSEIIISDTEDSIKIGNGAGNYVAVEADGSINVNAAVTGTVDVGNFPVVYPITDNGGSLTVDGSVAVSNFPATQVVSDGGSSITVDGTVSFSNTAIGVNNFPATYPVTDNGGSLTVDGTVAATQSGTWNITNVSGTVSLPTGASTAANQTSGNTSLTNIANNTTNVVSTANSTTTPLAGGATFTGTGEDVLRYGTISVSIFANVTGSFTVQWSNDNVSWRADVDTYVVSAGVLKKTTYGPGARYFRVVYTNGGSAQATFFIQTIHHANYMKPSTHRVAEAITDDSDSELVKAIFSGKRNDNTYGNARLTNGNNLVVALGEVDASVTLPVSAALNNSNSAALTSITNSTSSQTAIASNANRKSFTLYNDSLGDCYVAFASSATTSAFTVKMVPGAYYERALPNYTGAISCIWSGATTGALKATELT